MAPQITLFWRLAAWSSAARFVLLSGFSLGLNVGLTTGLHELVHLSEEMAFLVALIAAFLCNFVGMRYFVYRDSSGGIAPQLAKFLASSAGFRGLEYLAFLLLHTLLGVYYVLACLTVLGTSFVAKYFFYKIAVFGAGRRSKPARHRKLHRSDEPATGATPSGEREPPESSE